MLADLQTLRAGEIFAARYRVLRMIRAGGMGAVYEVEDLATRRRRALKLMHPSLVQSAESRARFEREVFIGAELETEHVVEVIDAGLDAASQVPFLTMELLRGEELGDRLDRLGFLPPDETCHVLAQIARALDKAHARGIVHRDLKPENVFLTFREDGSLRTKVLDFGIAKIVAQGGGDAARTTQASGTPLYMAPEQTDRNGQVSMATDVWALGLVAFRMLVGDSYWEGASLQQLYRQILVDPMESASRRASAIGATLPPEFDLWFARTVNRDPSQRFTSTSECVASLSQMFNVDLTKAIVVAPPPHDPNATPRPSVANDPQASAGAVPSSPSPSHSSGQSPAIVRTEPTPPSVHSGAFAATEMGAAIAAATARPSRRPPSATRRIGVGVSIALVAGCVAFFVHKSQTSDRATDDPTPAQSGSVNGAIVHDSSKKKAVRDAAREEPKAPLAWRADTLNPFLEVPTASCSLQTHEVTRGEYARFLATPGGHAEAPLDGANDLHAAKKASIEEEVYEATLPVTWVTFRMASAYCAAIEARLPTAKEWDAAVTGGDKRKYPWGNQWPAAGSVEAKHLAVGRGDHAALVEVGTSTSDRGPYGHLDLAGNVQEWTSTDSADSKEGGKLLRGSSVSLGEHDFVDPGDLLDDGSAAKPLRAGNYVGFRCARDR